MINNDKFLILAFEDANHKFLPVTTPVLDWHLIEYLRPKIGQEFHADFCQIVNYTRKKALLRSHKEIKYVLK